MNNLPLARCQGIVVKELSKEILVYDLSIHKAYNLNETAAIVYQACDGKTTFDDLKVKNNFTDEIVFFALDELRRENLLEENHSYDSPFSEISRREAIWKVGLNSMIALPVIVSLMAPTAAMAQSSGALLAAGAACTTGTQCASGVCGTCSVGGAACAGIGGSCTAAGTCTFLRTVCTGPAGTPPCTNIGVCTADNSSFCDPGGPVGGGPCTVNGTCNGTCQ